MTLRVYNTLSGEKELFEPVIPGFVSIYLCGPTVYKPAHIGHAVGPVIFDVIKRYLTYKGYKVTWVVNVTDVEDKLIAQAAQQGTTVMQLARSLEQQYVEVLNTLGVRAIDHMPRASEHIAEIIAHIEQLIARGAAYVVEGDVYFDVSKDADYGKLSRRKAEEQHAGTREGLVRGGKRNPGDFALWKAAKPEEPDDVKYDSPWGKGRPGWHIECSAMAGTLLGQVFDIHGGGIDLVFPHHENEIAQSRCAFHRPVMANFWLHNGFVQMEGDKMSKSVGNIIKIREALADWPGEVIRLNMLRTHYRQPTDWTVRGLEESWRILDEWYATAADAPEDRISGRVLEALADDLNTPEAVTALHALRNLAQGGDKFARDELATSLRFLGLMRDTAVIWEARKQVARGIDPARVEALIAERNAARKAKDFAEADRIRGELTAMGVEIRDSKDGTTWEVAT